MLLNSVKVFAGVMLMIGGAQAQVGNNAAPPPPPVWTSGSAGQGTHVIIPESSIPGPNDAGNRAHTNIRELVPNGPAKPPAGVANPLVGPPSPALSLRRRPPLPASIVWSL
jgi:hypothetical protein